MKKIIMTFGLAVAAFGFYSGAFGENTNYINEDYSIITNDFQDTIPGKKRDTTNRRPMPQDTMKRDSIRVNF